MVERVTVILGFCPTGVFLGLAAIGVRRVLREVGPNSALVVVGRDVLVEPEEIGLVVLPLEGLQATVLLGAVRLADPLLALIHQEVDVHTRVVGESAAQYDRAYSRSSSNLAADSVPPARLKVWPAARPLKAVSPSPT